MIINPQRQGLRRRRKEAKGEEVEVEEEEEEEEHSEAKGSGLFNKNYKLKLKISCLILQQPCYRPLPQLHVTLLQFYNVTVLHVTSDFLNRILIPIICEPPL
jgi:hypothetical protein